MPQSHLGLSCGMNLKVSECGGAYWISGWLNFDLFKLGNYSIRLGAQHGVSDANTTTAEIVGAAPGISLCCSTANTNGLPYRLLRLAATRFRACLRQYRAPFSFGRPTVK